MLFRSTPLSYRKPDGPIIELLTGSFDAPERLAPTYEVGTESKLQWLSRLANLPGKTTSEKVGTETAASVQSYQHPDHDTDADWRPPPTRS